MSASNGYISPGRRAGLPAGAKPAVLIPQGVSDVALDGLANFEQQPFRAHPSMRAPLKTDLVIGKNIRDTRRAKNLTQQDVASMIGVTGAQLHRYEAGTTRVAASRLIGIAGALGVSVDALMRSAESRTIVQPVELPAFADTDGFVELLATFSKISSESDRRAILAIGRMLAEKRPAANNASRDDSGG